MEKVQGATITLLQLSCKLDRLHAAELFSLYIT